MQSGFSIASFDAVCELYAQFLSLMLPALRPCPLCGVSREIQGHRERAVLWAVGCIDCLALVRLRCRRCRTVETLFPYWCFRQVLLSWVRLISLVLFPPIWGFF